MTGENFKRLDRKNTRLLKLLHTYRTLSDEVTDLYNTKIRYDEETNDEWARYLALQEKILSVGQEIWFEAFYTYGRTHQVANDFCERNGILRR